MPLLAIARIFKSFSGKAVLRDVSLHVDAGEIVCLLGPSGCGKTTLLRIIAGLETPDAGAVTFDGRDLANVPIHRRGFGLMFQDFALFPHKNVRENVSFGLKMQHLPAEPIERQVQEAMALVGLTGFEARDVNDLSGGEKQRVALARSLAPKPRLQMLDEPLGSLDRVLREELMNGLRRILKAAGLTSIYVTHDQQEAFAIADRVVLMNAGQIEQIGAPQAVYHRPASEWTARFLGLTNLLPGTDGPDGLVETPIGSLRIEGARSIAGPFTVLIHPNAASLAAQMEDERPNRIEGVLVEQSFRGGHTLAIVRVGAVDLAFEFNASIPLPAPGRAIRLALDPHSISLLAHYA